MTGGLDWNKEKVLALGANYFFHKSNLNFDEIVHAVKTQLNYN